MNEHTSYRLNGLEPDNLLAFMTLLGLLRTLEESRPDWHPRTSWTVDEPPVRPTLLIAEKVQKDDIVKAVAEGLNALAKHHDFSDKKDFNFSPEEAAESLEKARNAERYRADLWSALMSNVAISQKKKVEPTPFCLMFGAGRQYFLPHLALAPRQKNPPKRGSGRNKVEISETKSLNEALFSPWERPDSTRGEGKATPFRWDPQEYRSYALRATDPSADGGTTQHGANRLAAIGLSVLTVVPQRPSGTVRLGVIGGGRQRSNFTFSWPIWRSPVSLVAIRAMLSHPHLSNPTIQTMLGIIERRRATCISSGRYNNFTRGEVIE